MMWKKAGDIRRSLKLTTVLLSSGVTAYDRLNYSPLE
jgi:hypothetical protein